MAVTAEVAIANLLYRYAECVDAGDFDGVSELFAEGDYFMRGGTELRGVQVGDAMRNIVITYDGSPRTRHVMTNPIIEIADDSVSATVRSSFTVFQTVEGFPLQPIIIGGYHDRFACVDGEWRFAQRRIHVDLVGDTSHHIRMAMAAR
jgi:3-phenylpropionate/cinnamic acid dioxygenase small subunit